MAVTTSSGNGFALYNGVKLPNIDSVWTGELKQTLPYVVVEDYARRVESDFGKTINGSIYKCYFLDDIPYCRDGDVVEILPPYNGKYTVLYTTEEALQIGSAFALPADSVGIWHELQDCYASDSSNHLFGFVIWTSGDILNTNGSVYLSASDPISLDGYTVIEWDGDTTGLVSSSGNTHYKVSDVVLSASDLVGSVIAFGSEAVVVPTEFITNGEGYASIDAYVLSCQNEGVSFFDNTFPEKGLYFINAFDVHLPFFAYPASGGGGDGGDTSTARKHYCRVNGSVHEVEGGTARVSGSYHEIEVGTVRIEGAYYEIPFSGGSEGGGDEGGGSLDGVIFQAGEGLLQGTVTATPNNPSFTTVISYSVTDSYITTKGGNVQQTVGGNTVYIPAFYTLTIGPFDATDYDTLHVELTSSIGVVKCESGIDSVASGVITNSATAEEVTLDISGLSGECNVVIAPSSNITSSTIFNATIYKIWLT